MRFVVYGITMHILFLIWMFLNESKNPISAQTMLLLVCLGQWFYAIVLDDKIYKLENKDEC